MSQGPESIDAASVLLIPYKEYKRLIAREKKQNRLAARLVQNEVTGDPANKVSSTEQLTEEGLEQNKVTRESVDNEQKTSRSQQ